MRVMTVIRFDMRVCGSIVAVRARGRGRQVGGQSRAKYQPAFTHFFIYNFLLAKRSLSFLLNNNFLLNLVDIRRHSIINLQFIVLIWWKCSLLELLWWSIPRSVYKIGEIKTYFKVELLCLWPTIKPIKTSPSRRALEVQ